MAQMDSALFPSSSSTSGTNTTALRNVVICGMGGVGKTELAIEYALSNQAKFDAIFWVNSDNLGTEKS